MDLLFIFSIYYTVIFNGYLIFYVIESCKLHNWNCINLMDYITFALIMLIQFVFYGWNIF